MCPAMALAQLQDCAGLSEQWLLANMVNSHVLALNVVCLHFTIARFILLVYLFKGSFFKESFMNVLNKSLTELV